jgi:hypothetical protein
MASFSFFPALNLMALDALILIASPVWGLRPLRAFRRIFENVPNPTRVTFPSFFFSSFAMLFVNEFSAGPGT